MEGAVSTIVDLAQHRKDEGPVVCLYCGDNWWAVRSKGQLLVECPNCKSMTGHTLAQMLMVVQKQCGEVFTERLRTAIDAEYG